MWVGFARVSTREQDLNNQLEALRQSGCEKTIHGKHSGSSEENDGKLAELVSFVREGDVVVVTKLDRLGRSLKMILQTLEDIHDKGAMLKTLDGSIDTSQQTPFSKAMVSLIGTFAELERNLIVSRTTEGREAAKKKGVKFGRKPSLSEEEQLQALQKLRTGQSVRATAKEFGVTRQTLYRVLKRFPREGVKGRPGSS
ncbi:recombinase family protein [Marinobacter sediminum]|uniref:recombinase family protein n=1 Tax=Marinobacter sediminum TaxID=256323 RepID=UPI00202DEE29|nr:recombinase family protein [Marinobacter sediminum]MCM0613388.1 recombinase family protein [Marinobacter sediminum]